MDSETDFGNDMLKSNSNFDNNEISQVTKSGGSFCTTFEGHTPNMSPPVVVDEASSGSVVLTGPTNENNAVVGFSCAKRKSAGGRFDVSALAIFANRHFMPIPTEMFFTPGTANTHEACPAVNTKT